MFCCAACPISYQPKSCAYTASGDQRKQSCHAWLNAYKTNYTEAAQHPNHDKPSTCHLHYNCHFYLWCFYLNESVSKYTCDCCTRAPSSTSITNGSIFSTWYSYIDCDPSIDDPVSESACHFATYILGAAIVSDSSILEHTAPPIATCEDAKTINILSPASLVNAFSHPPLPSQPLLPSQPKQSYRR